VLDIPNVQINLLLSNNDNVTVNNKGARNIDIFSEGMD